MLGNYESNPLITDRFVQGAAHGPLVHPMHQHNDPESYTLITETITLSQSDHSAATLSDEMLNLITGYESI